MKHLVLGGLTRCLLCIIKAADVTASIQQRFNNLQITNVRNLVSRSHSLQYKNHFAQLQSGDRMQLEHLTTYAR